MRFFGIGFVALALVAAITPLFTDCQSQGRAITLANGKTIPMKCHWTGQAELALALPLVAVGMMTTASRRRETIRALSVAGIFLGAMVLFVPSMLIGVCASNDMLCNLIMRPTLMMAGALTMGIGLVTLIRARGEVATVPVSNEPK